MTRKCLIEHCIKEKVTNKAFTSGKAIGYCCDKHRLDCRFKYDIEEFRKDPIQQ